MRKCVEKGSFRLFVISTYFIDLFTMKKLLVLLCLLTGSGVMAQKTEGVVTYVRKEYWLKIMNRLTFLNQEQKDRMTQTFKNWAEDNKGIKMKLAFNANQSLYTYNSDEPEEGGYSWRK